MTSNGNPKYLRYGGLFLLACVIMPVFFLGCSCGKSVENSKESRRHIASEVKSDGIGSFRLRDYRNIEKDSVYKFDSVVVEIRGDTVIKDRWHYTGNEKIKTVYLTDTLVMDRWHYMSKTDTLYLYKDKKVEVEKKLTWWEQKKQEYGGIAIISSIVFAAIFCITRIKDNDKKRCS